MENAITSLICIMLILVGTATVALSANSSIDKISGSWKKMDQVMLEERRTDIVGTGSQVSDNGTRVEVTIMNEGAISIDDFEEWDVIVQHEDGKAVWLPHAASAPGWTVSGLTFDGSPEVFDPEILNPGEEIRLQLNLDPPVSENTTNRVTVSTANGTTAELMFRG